MQSFVQSIFERFLFYSINFFGSSEKELGKVDESDLARALYTVQATYQRSWSQDPLDIRTRLGNKHTGNSTSSR